MQQFLMQHLECSSSSEAANLGVWGRRGGGGAGGQALAREDFRGCLNCLRIAFRANKQTRRFPG